MTSVAHLDPLPFRTRVLHGQFESIQIGDTVYLTIMPAFVKMYDLGMLFQEGKVVQIIDPEVHNDVREHLVVVKTEMGQWTFTRDGLSLNKIAQLSIYVRATGKRLDLYEPILQEGTPPADVVLVKTAECGCSFDGPCDTHKHAKSWWEKAGFEMKNARRELFSSSQVTFRPCTVHGRDDCTECTMIPLSVHEQT